MVAKAGKRARSTAKVAVKASSARVAKRASRKTSTGIPSGLGFRMAAPDARLGMTAGEVRDASGQPECILFGADDHVEWQFGAMGVDVVGAPTLYVTTLTFEAGRVVRITERMSEAS